MEYYENYDEAFIDEFDPFFEDEAYADFEYLDGDEAYGEDERRRYRRRRPRNRKNQLVLQLQAQVRSLRRKLRQSKHQGGASATAVQRLTALEKQLDSMQQTQLFTSLLDIPQIESLTFEGEKGTQAVKHTTYDQSTTLLLSLLSGNGLAGSKSKGGLDIKTLMLLSLLGNGGQGGLMGGGNNGLLLLLLLLGDKK